jgi:hypothetical protein
MLRILTLGLKTLFYTRIDVPFRVYALTGSDTHQYRELAPLLRNLQNTRPSI